MKMKVSAISFTLFFATQSNAAWNSCGFGDYKTVYTSLAQGVGVDSSSISTDCYTSAQQLGSQTEQFTSSFTNWSSSDWAKPLYIAAELSTEYTNVFSACQTTNLAKQFSVRMNSLGGLFDLFSTVGVSILIEFVTKPGKSELYNSFKAANSATDCATTTLNFAKSVKLLMSYQAQPANYSN